MSVSAAGPALNAYWGQTAGNTLRQVCDAGVNYATVSFINNSPEHGSGFPGSNFGANCGGDLYVNNGVTTKLLKGCTQIQQDIPYCQSKGVKVLLAIGGVASSTSNYTVSSDAKGVEFAQFMYNAFGPYNSSWTGPRPFDISATQHVSVDGFDLDLENKEKTFSNSPYIAMVNWWRKQSQKLFITAAPECVITRNGNVNKNDDLIANAEFDALFIQFYNNQVCDAIPGNLLGGGDQFSYNDWTTNLQNGKSKNAKLFIGLPASPLAAGSGYILPKAMKDLVCSYSTKSNFGGVSLWDGTLGLGNVDITTGVSYLQSARDAVKYLCSNPPATTTTTKTTATSTKTTSTSTKTTSTSTKTTSTSTKTTATSTKTTSTSTKTTATSTKTTASSTKATTSSTTSSSTATSTKTTASSTKATTSSTTSSTAASSTKTTASSTKATTSSAASSSTAASSTKTTASSTKATTSSAASSSTAASSTKATTSSAASSSTAASSTAAGSTATTSSSADVTSSATSQVTTKASATEATSSGVAITSSSSYWSNSTATTTKPVSFTTSTVYTTSVHTVTKCPPTVTNCPVGHVTTETIPLYTTVCPITESHKPTTTKAPAQTTKAPVLTTSTVYTTKIYTVTHCPPTVTNCPVGHVTTEVVPLYTTVCPVEATETGNVPQATGGASAPVYQPSSLETSIRSTVAVPQPSNIASSGSSGCTGPECPGVAIPTNGWTVAPVSPSATPSAPVTAGASTLALGLTGLVALVAAQVLAM